MKKNCYYLYFDHDAMVLLSFLFVFNLFCPLRWVKCEKWREDLHCRLNDNDLCSFLASWE